MGHRSHVFAVKHQELGVEPDVAEVKRDDVSFRDSGDWLPVAAMRRMGGEASGSGGVGGESGMNVTRVENEGSGAAVRKPDGETDEALAGSEGKLVQRGGGVHGCSGRSSNQEQGWKVHRRRSPRWEGRVAPCAV